MEKFRQSLDLSKEVNLGVFKPTRRQLLRILISLSIGGLVLYTKDEGTHHTEIQRKPAPDSDKQKLHK